MVRRSHVATEFICVATGNGHYASGKLVAIRHSARHKGALSRTIDMRVRLGCPHDRGASMTTVLCRERDFSVATDLDSDEKKTLGIWGIT